MDIFLWSGYFKQYLLSEKATVGRKTAMILWRVYLKEWFDIGGKALACFLGQIWERRRMPLKSLVGEYEATARRWFA